MDVFAGRYKLVELMGEGNSKEVWKARDQLADDAEVVLKIYAPEKRLDDDGFSQLRREFFRFKDLSHPHLLKVQHFDVSEGIPYLTMPGDFTGSLTRLLEEKRSFNERQVALILKQIGSALEELHSQKPPVLHQNVHPNNIVIARTDYFLLADFGINSPIRPGLPKSTTEAKPGTVAYAPPENSDRFQKTDGSEDIFSLGRTLYAICAKTVPLSGSEGPHLKGGDVPQLPEYYSTELNKLLQACISANRSERPSAAELHLRGKQFLETGQWNLSEKGNEESNSLKRLKPFLLSSAVFVLFLVGAYWAYQNNHLAIPMERLQKVATSVNQGRDQNQHQDLDEMLVATLEDELEEMKKRIFELEEENKQLKRIDSGNSILGKNQKQPREGNYVQAAKKDHIRSINNVKTNGTASSSAAPPKDNSTVFLTKALEKQLNKISDPVISGNARKSWKKETMAQFSEKAVRIVDETEGTPKQYSASIFLNLLYNVPHTIVVKEVKRDQNKKVTELRLTMQTKM